MFVFFCFKVLIAGRLAAGINLSLSALGDVIGCLSSGEKFVPYRNNKLTMLLQVLEPHFAFANIELTLYAPLPFLRMVLEATLKHSCL